MPNFFIGDLPNVMYHGSQTPETLLEPCPPASECRCWNPMDWDDYDADDED